MPIKLLNTVRGHQPMVICDYCGNSIESARDSNYEWRENPAGVESLTEVTFLHKSCSRPNQQKLGGHLLSMELIAFLPRLAYNLKVEPQEQSFAATMYGVGEDFAPPPQREPTPLRLVKPTASE